MPKPPPRTKAEKPLCPEMGWATWLVMGLAGAMMIFAGFHHG